MESPVAQWLEHPTRSRRVVGSNPIWSSEFFSEFPIDVKNLITLLFLQRLFGGKMACHFGIQQVCLSVFKIIFCYQVSIC